MGMSVRAREREAVVLKTYKNVVILNMQFLVFKNLRLHCNTCKLLCFYYIIFMKIVWAKRPLVGQEKLNSVYSSIHNIIHNR
jgi:hypothetical protein